MRWIMNDPKTTSHPQPPSGGPLATSAADLFFSGGFFDRISSAVAVAATSFRATDDESRDAYCDDVFFLTNFEKRRSRQRTGAERMGKKKKKRNLIGKKRNESAAGRDAA